MKLIFSQLVFLGFSSPLFSMFCNVSSVSSIKKNSSQTKIKTKQKIHQKHKYHQALSEPSPPKKTNRKCWWILGPNLPRWIPYWNPEARTRWDRDAPPWSLGSKGEGFPGYFFVPGKSTFTWFPTKKTVLIYSYLYTSIHIMEVIYAFLSGKEDISITIVHYREDKLRTSPLKLYLHCSSTTFFRG